MQGRGPFADADRTQIAATVVALRGRPLGRATTGIAVSRERNDYLDGCAAFRDFPVFVVLNRIGLPSLDPHVAAPWTLAGFRAGRDPAMEAVHARLAAAAPE